jgi:hypothetical protein
MKRENIFWTAGTVLLAFTLAFTACTGVLVPSERLSLGGTIDITLNGQRPSTVEIYAYTELYNPSVSKIGQVIITGYNTSTWKNNWTMTVGSPKQNETVYFRIDMQQTPTSAWFGYQDDVGALPRPVIPANSTTPITDITITFDKNGSPSGETFIITGLPSGAHEVYAISTNPSTPTAAAAAISSPAGRGAAHGPGTDSVIWTTMPSNKTYTIILTDSSHTSFKKAAGVIIYKGGGNAAYSSFVDISSSSGGGGETVPATGTFRIRITGIPASVMTNGANGDILIGLGLPNKLQGESTAIAGRNTYYSGEDSFAASAPYWYEFYIYPLTFGSPYVGPEGNYDIGFFNYADDSKKIIRNRRLEVNQLNTIPYSDFVPL